MIIKTIILFFNYLVGGQVVKARDQGICSSYDLRFESRGC